MRDPRDSVRGIERDRDKDYRSNASNDSSSRDPRARGIVQNQDKDFRSSKFLFIDIIVIASIRLTRDMLILAVSFTKDVDCPSHNT